MEHCVIRTYCNKYSNTTSSLEQRLKQGWMVKFITPFVKHGDTDYVEYILERVKSNSQTS